MLSPQRDEAEAQAEPGSRLWITEFSPQVADEQAWNQRPLPKKLECGEALPGPRLGIVELTGPKLLNSSSANSEGAQGCT